LFEIRTIKSKTISMDILKQLGTRKKKKNKND